MNLALGYLRASSSLGVCITSQRWRLHLNHDSDNRVTAHVQRRGAAELKAQAAVPSGGFLCGHQPTPLSYTIISDFGNRWILEVTGLPGGCVTAP